MTGDLDHAWERIETWLHLNVPKVKNRLSAPATSAELALVESAYGLQIPADLRAWWKHSNGMTYGPSDTASIILPGLYVPSSTHQSIETHNFKKAATGELARRDADLPSLLELFRSQPAGISNDSWVHLDEWIILARGGDDLFVDCRAGASYGCVMESFRHGGQRGPVWGSVTEMWKEVADLLESLDPSTRPELINTSQGEWYLPESWWN